MNEPELSPCPFCGGEALRFEEGEDGAEPCVCCQECGASRNTPAEWNHRVSVREPATEPAFSEAKVKLLVWQYLGCENHNDRPDSEACGSTMLARGFIKLVEAEAARMRAAAVSSEGETPT
jgi:hypothetical protein